jgi:hypothetical protein
MGDGALTWNARDLNIDRVSRRLTLCSINSAALPAVPSCSWLSTLVRLGCRQRCRQAVGAFVGFLQHLLGLVSGAVGGRSPSDA